ncbi:MAG: hypothetical protein AUG49_23050 [Catenulispora sp. 13_1_20CM_3_70_7]|nr:MAG: hypothetical protein AUG49_23050 [Catenulispora sp. 13_1_20CM_3_70_7]
MLDDRDRPADGREDLEAALVLHYSRLVRIAYVALPPEGDRHGRVLAAHAIVQRTLPGTGWLSGRLGSRLGGRLGAERPNLLRRRTLRPVESDSYAVLRTAVVRSVLRGNRWLRATRQPHVWGLRLFPLGGGSEEMQVDAALRGLSTTARMAYVLLGLEDLDADATAALLSSAGARGIPAALYAAERLLAEHPADVLQSSEFDPCTLRTRPTDLSRRRRRVRGVASAGAAVVAVGVAAVIGFSSSDSHALTGGEAGAQAPIRIAADAWKTSARIDFGTWPARGDDTTAANAVPQALEAWTEKHPDAFHLGPGASDTPPVLPVHILWTGHLDGATVVLLYDTTRLARYTVPDHPTAADAVRLDLVRADDSDLTTAGAVVLRSTADGDRWLVAPWIEAASMRDLRTPDATVQPMLVTDGVTPAVTRPAVDTCASWPVLQLQASPMVAEHYSFLLADLGGVTGAHLTYTPPPKAGPAQPPREGTAADALAVEARAVCGLASLPDRDVKQVNTWAFAQQTLPQNQGIATWVCLRADDWSGTGSATGEFLPPAARTPISVTGTEDGGKSCSRFDQDVVTQTRWRAPDGRTFLLMAGSRHVVKLGAADASGAVRQTTNAPDHTAAVVVGNGDGVPATTSAAGILDTGQTVLSLRS